MKGFIIDKYLQLVLLFLLVIITGYTMYIGDMDLIRSILLAVFAGLDIKQLVK